MKDKIWKLFQSICGGGNSLSFITAVFVCMLFIASGFAYAAVPGSIQFYCLFRLISNDGENLMNFPLFIFINSNFLFSSNSGILTQIFCFRSGFMRERIEGFQLKTLRGVK